MIRVKAVTWIQYKAELNLKMNSFYSQLMGKTHSVWSQVRNEQKSMWRAQDLPQYTAPFYVILKRRQKVSDRPLSLWSRYSSRTRMIWMIERMREPNARVPVWYLKRYKRCSSRRWSKSSEEKNKKTHTPERSAKRRKYGEGRHVVWLDKSPVVRGKGPRQSHLPQRRDKVGAPKEEKDVVELQANQVFVVNGLSAVEGKKALRVRALRLHGCGRVVLRTHIFRFIDPRKTWSSNILTIKGGVEKANQSKRCLKTSFSNSHRQGKNKYGK